MNKCNETNKANRQIIKKWTEVETQLAELLVPIPEDTDLNPTFSCL